PHATAHRPGHSVPQPVSGDQPWTEERIRALGAVTDLVTAGQIFGLGRSFTYNLMRTGQFPVPVLRLGNRYRVPVGGILTTLGFTSANDLINGVIEALIVTTQSDAATRCTPAAPNRKHRDHHPHPTHAPGHPGPRHRPARRPRPRTDSRGGRVHRQTLQL
ncbi:MAG TPA: hypothetical protein VN408_24510, partial [Actinoplanes sp.]|nr:hypothetical protein [Actinoplanes sp.]